VLRLKKMSVNKVGILFISSGKI